MGSNWKTYTMDELYDVSSGLSKKREEFGFGYPFLTFKEVFHNIFVPESLPELANTTEKERERCSIKKGDVFLTRTSEKLEELGLSCVALKDYENATFNGFTKRLRPNDLCNKILLPEYAAFYFSSNAFRNQVTSFASMTTRASLNNEMISKLKIDVPSLYVQKQIANIMRNLLQKEQLNNQMVKNLEKIAVELFKRWFIDFEFPNEQGLPYRSSGGEMVESELGEIPENWEVVQVKDICEANIKSLSKKDNWTELNYLDTGNITGNSIDTIQFINLNEEKAPSRAKRLVEPNDIVFSTVRPNQKHYGIIKEPVHNMVVSTGFAVLSTNTEYSSELLYLYLTQQNMMDNFQAIAEQSTSAYPAIKAEDILKQKILRPTNEVLADISRILSSNFNCIWELQQENKRLAQLRDTLLPKLLSGEIEIRDESVVEPS